ncbi:MAG: hypothetical protein HUU57_16065, partial [Bdellovibrio sp.]|nr:hypothetical protein [Bdellovibrio sp.]
AGVGTFASSTRANLGADGSAVSRGCSGNSGFTLQLPFHVVQARWGLPIYVHAVDPASGNLIPLEGSGNFYLIQDTGGR